jgi:prophage maintenance system killer protein
MGRRLTFERFALITAEVYDTPVDEVESKISRSRAEVALAAPFPGPDEIVLYPDPVEQAAICFAAIIRLRPLPHDNKRVAHECLGEMLVNYQWRLPSEDDPEATKKMDEWGAREMSEGGFITWVRAYVGRCAWQWYERHGKATA